MTSELRVDNLKGSTTGGSINVLGEGTSATTNLQQGLIKAWNSLDQNSGVATDDSFNLTSLTDNRSGDHTQSFVNNMNNNDYSVTGNEKNHNLDGGWHTAIILVGAKAVSNWIGVLSTSQYSIITVKRSDGSYVDTESSNQVTGDLA